MTLERLLMTGAAGGLGRAMRLPLAGMARQLRLSDIAPMGEASSHEELVTCDLADAKAVRDLLDGVDAVVHFGGQSVEAEWPVILAANITGLVNLYEAARAAGTQRIIFASSNHAIGMHPRSRRLDHRSPPRADSRYGVSKAFGEELAAFYAMKYGIRSLCIRIGTSIAEPRSRRHLSTWLSFADLAELIRVGLTADYLVEIVYGVSANRRSWWDNANAARLGFTARDDSERFAAKVEGIAEPDPVAEALQGGTFASAEYVGDLARCLEDDPTAGR